MKANSGPGAVAIEEIRSHGRDLEPVVPILRHGLQDKLMAKEVEAAIIDTMGLENLTNLCRGKHIERACRLGRLLPPAQWQGGSSPWFCRVRKDKSDFWQVRGPTFRLGGQ
ncbi:MAG: hypothetical protein ACJ8G3_06400 [Burkholderiaceae bacterium]